MKILLKFWKLGKTIGTTVKRAFKQRSKMMYTFSESETDSGDDEFIGELVSRRDTRDMQPRLLKLPVQTHPGEEFEVPQLARRVDDGEYETVEIPRRKHRDFGRPVSSRPGASGVFFNQMSDEEDDAPLLSVDKQRSRKIVVRDREPEPVDSDVRPGPRSSQSGMQHSSGERAQRPRRDDRRGPTTPSDDSPSDGGGAGGGSSGGRRDDSNTPPEKGTMGTPVHLITNHFELRWTGEQGRGLQVYQFHIDFTPTDLPHYMRQRIVGGGRVAYGGPYIFDGGHEFYCSKLFTDGELQLEPRMSQAEEGVKYMALMKYTGVLPETDPVYSQFYNLIVKQCLHGMGLDEVGNSWIDTSTTIDYPQFRVQLWPGYNTSIKPCEKGILLCVDVTHKVVRNDDLLSRINFLKKMYRPESNKSLEEFILEEIRGAVVITPYNKKTYRVDGIELGMSPESKFQLKDGPETTFAEYYRTRYQVDIADRRQPMIYASLAKKGRRGKKEDLILIPELCMETGMTDDMRANNGVMKELSKHLHMDPKERIKMVHKFITTLAATQGCQDQLKEWGFTFETQLRACTIGRVLPPENIIFANRKVFKADDKADWTRALRMHEMLKCIDMTQWIVVVNQRDKEKVKDFVATMIKVARPLGFIIGQPKAIESLQDVRLAQYVRTLEQIVQRYPQDYLQMVLCVLPNNKADLYCAIKKRLTQDYGIQSQCLLARNLTSKAAMSIATKLVIQMNTKLGGEPWTVQLPPELEQRSIAIGFDFYKKSGYRGGKTGAFVASMNSDYSQYFSAVFSYAEAAEMEDKMKIALTKCLEVYAKKHKAKVPDTVVFFRSGAEESMVARGVIEAEAIKLNTALQDWFTSQQLAGVNFVYMMVNKQNNARLLTHKGNCRGGPVPPEMICNPPPGTVLDKDIVELDGKMKEFYLIPTVARQGTVRPIQYRVMFDTTNYSADVLQAYTFKLCHLYYNWSGTVNVPSVCQYAGKLAKQSAQAIPQTPHVKLGNFLHYL